MTNKNDIIIAFSAGFIPSGLKTYLMIDTYTPFMGFMIKIIGTIVIGACGGFAGILGKDFYKYLRKRYKFFTKNKQNEKQ